jgi:hypothetical protein
VADGTPAVVLEVAADLAAASEEGVFPEEDQVEAGSKS